MWASFVIVGDPETQRPPQMALVQGNHEIQAFPAHRAHQLFTIRVRRWCPRGSAQNLQIKVTLQLLVQLPREDRIAVVDQELITMVTGNGVPELLQRPICCRSAVTL